MTTTRSAAIAPARSREDARPATADLGSTQPIPLPGSGAADWRALDAVARAHRLTSSGRAALGRHVDPEAADFASRCDRASAAAGAAAARDATKVTLYGNEIVVETRRPIGSMRIRVREDVPVEVLADHLVAALVAGNTVALELPRGIPAPVAVHLGRLGGALPPGILSVTVGEPHQGVPVRYDEHVELSQVDGAPHVAIASSRSMSDLAAVYQTPSSMRVPVDVQSTSAAHPSASSTRMP